VFIYTSYKECRPVERREGERERGREGGREGGRERE